MTPTENAVAVLIQRPSTALMEIGKALSDGILRYGYSAQSLQPFCGPDAQRVCAALQDLEAAGMAQPIVSVLCTAIGAALGKRDEAERNVQLILSGPDIVGTPVVDTRTAVMSLFREAKTEVIISSYVFHDAAEFFSDLASRHNLDPSLRVCLLLDLSHLRSNAKESAAELELGFAKTFRKKHWPGSRLPELWHDARAFADGASLPGVLHAKSVIVDKRTALITSANFTGAAQTRNIEAGTLHRNSTIAAQLHAYFQGLISGGKLRRFPAG